MSFWANDFWADDFWADNFWADTKATGRYRRRFVEVDGKLIEIFSDLDAERMLEEPPPVKKAPKPKPMLRLTDEVRKIIKRFNNVP